MMEPVQIARLGDVLQLKYELAQAAFKKADQQAKGIEDACADLRQKYTDSAATGDITTFAQVETYRRWLNEQLKDQMIALAGAMAKRNEAQDLLGQAFGRKIAFEKMVEKAGA